MFIGVENTLYGKVVINALQKGSCIIINYTVADCNVVNIVFRCREDTIGVTINSDCESINSILSAIVPFNVNSMIGIVIDCIKTGKFDNKYRVHIGNVLNKSAAAYREHMCYYKCDIFNIGSYKVNIYPATDHRSGLYTYCDHVVQYEVIRCGDVDIFIVRCGKWSFQRVLWEKDLLRTEETRGSAIAAYLLTGQHDDMYCIIPY